MKALVVDAHPLYRGALATLARSPVGPDAAQETGNAETALALGTKPDLVLLDFRLLLREPRALKACGSRDRS